MKLDIGKILISDPFLKDENFSRTVVLLTEYNKDGAVGFVLNKLFSRTLNELVEFQHLPALPLYYGGPCQTDTLHFIHQRPDLIDEGKPIANNMFWGGNFEQATIHIANKTINTNDIKIFIGYSGWDTGQLEFELDEKSWIVNDSKNNYVFNNAYKTLWQDILEDMGGQYKLIKNYPLDPRLN